MPPKHYNERSTLIITHEVCCFVKVQGREGRKQKEHGTCIKHEKA